MSYEIVYGSFSGPMDVLLDLIKKREMDIYDIQIHVLVDDFLDYIEDMSGSVMDSVADFLAMASYLLAIKSRMLLPSVSEEDEEVEEDPRGELVERIVEYKRIKALSSILEEMEAYEEGAVYKKQEDFSDFSEKDLIAQTDVSKLESAFQEAIRRFQVHEEAKKSLEKISGTEYSFEQAEVKIREAFQKNGRPSFLAMVEDARSRVEIVTIFLMMLELIKAQRISCEQRGRDILLARKEAAYAS